MPFANFIIQAVFISLSGVMAPGPMTAITIGKGASSPHTGALIALGHGIVEFPLMCLILFGLGYYIGNPYVKIVITFTGAIFIFLMAADMLRNIRVDNIASLNTSHSPVVTGIIVSISNPYFIIWWATVGSALILRSASFGAFGFLLFTVIHWLCDFFWLYFLSALSFRGGKFFGKKFQRLVFLICGLILFLFGAVLFYDGLKQIIN